jgi:hypothetical protein
MWFVVLLAAAANAVSLSAPTVTVARDVKASARPELPETTPGPATIDDLHLLDRRDTLAQADATVCGYYNRAIGEIWYLPLSLGQTNNDIVLQITASTA